MLRVTKSINNSLRTFVYKSFHSSINVRGWNQLFAIGYGVPLPYDKLKLIEPNVTRISRQHIECFKFDFCKGIESTNPIVIDDEFENDGFILFDPIVYLYQMGLIIKKSEFLGPTYEKKDFVENALSSLPPISNSDKNDIHLSNQKLCKFLKDHTINPEQSTEQFYNLDKYKGKYNCRSLETWIDKKCDKKAKLKDVLGFYVMALD